MGRLDHKVALVTAGGGGIGQATVWRLAESGAQVLATDIDADGLAETLAQASAPDRIRTLISDATRAQDAAAAVAAAVAAFGGLQILVNVVGGSRPGKTVLEMEPDEWDGWIRLNLTSTYLMARAAIPEMARSGGGAIINIASGAGVTGMMKNPAYVAAKGGVIALTKSLAIDHAAAKIRANVIAPGAILTPLMKRNRRPEEIDFMSKMTLAGRIGMPNDIAAAVEFLASDDGEFINGELINVAGGRGGPI